MKRCWNKEIAESNSPEANAIKREKTHINYSYCKKYCRGDNPTCYLYVLREMQPIEEETMEDSSLERITGFDGFEQGGGNYGY